MVKVAKTGRQHHVIAISSLAIAVEVRLKAGRFGARPQPLAAHASRCAQWWELHPA